MFSKTAAKDSHQVMEDCRLQLSHTLQSSLQSNGQRRYATPPQQIAAFNRRTEPQTISTTIGAWVKPESDTVIGDDVLLLNPDLDYNIHFPMQRGQLNLHSGIGGSLTSVLANMESIWTYLIRNKLDISIKDLKLYRAVLVIPDICDRTHMRELISLLLNGMGFGACFLVQDHAAATFGAGLAYACVVDVGHEKTSVSCVEDGLSQANTRIRVSYGGGDITQSLHWLLQRAAFPYTTANPTISYHDAVLLQKLKHDLCHVNMDICGCQEKNFAVRQPGKPAVRYTFQVGDECLIAPLGLFQPELFDLTGKKTVTTQKRTLSDPEDPFDAEFIRETSRRGTKENMEEAGGDTTVVTGGEEELVVDEPSGGGEFIVDSGQLPGLDTLILDSIERCGTDDLKKKMYSCILIVGGGMKFSNIGSWLQNHLSLQIPAQHRPEQIDVITVPKEVDPEIATWKGASVMSFLESAQELWLTPAMWRKHSIKILRERAPFIW
nr:PREDICTED: actin-related protein 8 isoform X2 [Bemisia tabaci]